MKWIFDLFAAGSAVLILHISLYGTLPELYISSSVPA